MADDQQWQAPDAPKPPPPPSPYAPSGAALPPPVAPAAGQQLPPQANAAPAWTPPPKPGLVPLRPMTLGTVLGASFMILRRNPKPTLGPAIVIMLGVTLLTLFVFGAIITASFARFESAANADDADAILAGSALIGVLGGVLTILLGIVGGAVLQGIIVTEVARGTLGEKLRLRGLWAHLRGRFGALIGWALLLSGVLAVAVVLVVAVIAGLSALGDVAVVVGVLFGILVFFGGIVLVAWLSTKLLFVPAAIVLERRPVLEAVRRSWSLVRGYFWRTFGIVLLVGVMLGVAAQVVTTPISFVFGLGIGLIAPTGTDPTGAVVFGVVVYLLLFAVTAIVSAITLVIQTATSSLLYLDLRFRKEGLDLELARFVETRHSAPSTVPDPYLPRADAAAPPAPASGSSWS